MGEYGMSDSPGWSRSEERHGPSGQPGAGTRVSCCDGPRENMTRVTIYSNVIIINKLSIYLHCIPKSNVMMLYK